MGWKMPRNLTLARILLKADESWTGAETASVLDVGLATVEIQLAFDERRGGLARPPMDPARRAGAGHPVVGHRVRPWRYPYRIFFSRITGYWAVADRLDPTRPAAASGLASSVCGQAIVLP